MFTNMMQNLDYAVNRTELFAWLVVEMNLKVVWRFALEEYGGECVMTFGMKIMQ